MKKEADDEWYVLTFKGLLFGILDENKTKQVCDAVELHMRRHYGPTPGIVLDGGTLKFVCLEKVESQP